MELEIAGVKVGELVKNYPTPLYVYNQEQIESTLELFTKNFKSNQFDTKILYASKAFQAIALLNLVSEYGLGLDVVSKGEFFAASHSKMPVDDIYFHGNNKTFEELDYAISEIKIEHIVVDNLMELEVISELASKAKRPIQIMLRLNVGIEAHTHQYIITSHIDSKFGMSHEGQEFKACLSRIENDPYLILEGFHSHIGSQIFDMTAWYASIDKLFDVLSRFEKPLTINIGGGFGIRYTDEDQPLKLNQIAKDLISYVEKTSNEKSVTIDKLMIEPGRSLIAESGLTLYTVGFLKHTPNKNYLFVDGGMGDNIRPSLYQAKYDADVVNRLDEEKTENYTIAGKFCESGDILIENIKLPPAKTGDILAVYSTGAYGYSMASNYNRNVIPGVVFIKNGQAKEVIKRQSFEQLIENEVF